MSETSFQPRTKSLILQNLNINEHEVLLRFLLLLPADTVPPSPQSVPAAAPLLMHHDPQQGHCLRMNVMPKQDGFPNCDTNSS